MTVRKRAYAVAEAVKVPDNIQLHFVYITKYKNLENVPLNFTGKYFYSLEEGDKIVLVRRNNDKYPSTIFPVKLPLLGEDDHKSRFINSVTAIIGQNGSGKSNILDFLRRILSNNLFYNEESLIVLEIDGETKAFHSFNKDVVPAADLNIEIINSTSPLSFIEQYHRKQSGETEKIEKLDIGDLSFSKVVYYSSQADLQSFPFNFDDPPYNDISTNYLLEFDHGKGEEYAKSKFDKILSHKSQTIRRFIDLIYSGLPFPPDITDFIPKHTYIQINRLTNPENSSRNLNFNDKEFQKLFLNKLNESWNKSHELKKAKSDEYYKVLLKTELSYSIMNHFFHNKEDVYGADSKVDIKGIDWNASMEEIVRFYLDNQKWKPSQIPSLLYESLLSAINKSDEFSENTVESFSFRVSHEDVDLITLYSNYVHYEDLFEATNHPSGLLDFYWRGISSGEKSLLDLFGRLLDTKNRRFINAGAHNPKEGNRYNTIFLLIDEGEIGFHPQWQKNYLMYLIEFLQYAYAGFNLQLILTSHSPFLISDLPRENIIFMKKEGENSEVVDPKALNLTFGGNIHEMLIDSFFLEGGIIGAFSQKKINNVISQLIDDDPLSQERISEIKRIIEAIGEPVVRVKLLHMLSEKKLKDSI